MLEAGLKSESAVVVGESNNAAAMGSGDMNVFATPAMVALMENAAMNAVAGYLPEGSTTVGAAISVSHVKPTAPGGMVTAVAELTDVDGRKLTFRVTASDTTGIIGEGSHVRYIVDREKFLLKL